MTASSPPAEPAPDDAFGRWLAAHPAATLLEIAAFPAARTAMERPELGQARPSPGVGRSA